MNDQEYARMMADLDEVLAYDWPVEIALDGPVVAAAFSEGAATCGDAGTPPNGPADEPPARIGDRESPGTRPSRMYGSATGIATDVITAQRRDFNVAQSPLPGQHPGKQWAEEARNDLVNNSRPSSSAVPTGLTPLPSSIAFPGSSIKICHSPNDVPPGRQPAKILQCGLCTSGKLFDRAYEIKRHMATHFAGQFACPEPGCGCVGFNAFTRKDKLVKHMREVHGGM